MLLGLPHKFIFTFSPAPAVVGQVTHVPGPGGSANKPPADPKQAEDEAKKTLNVDAAQPATNVQVGSFIQIKFRSFQNEFQCILN